MYTNLLSPLPYMPPIQVPIEEECLLFMHIRYPKSTYPTHFKHIEAVRMYNFWGGKRFVGFAYQGKDIVFRCIIEYGSLRDFGP